MIDKLVLETINAAESEERTDDLVALYVEIYTDAGEFYGEDRYRRQLTLHRQRPGWQMVTATVDGELVGYIYGFPLAPDTKWWNGIEEPYPAGFTEEDGRRTFALSELLVRPAWQRQGIARALHDELVGARPESRMTLLARPDNAPAQAAYRSWGWQWVTCLRPAWGNAPLFEVLIREHR
ncbi:GNAT family N-acetyltransferase [Micromonospora sp. NPDC048871]|uniref:GNAT family N-acetyltransferase n=1 Tax=unclassified Micromonospora TaxID=2617518 RepID=UPI002E0E6AAD|nr:GNAT family N-acetyltransferase [Micromonospora sp. NBC_01739]